MHRKGLVIGILILLLGVNIGGVFAGDVDVTVSTVSFDGNTLYVGGSGPNNYTTIKSAINDAVDGDTVFVYDDSSPYLESVRIDKSLQLIGENKNTTIIDSSSQTTIRNYDSDNILIKGFTILNHFSNQDNNYGVWLSFTKNSTLTETRIIGCHRGVQFLQNSKCYITNNEIKDGYIGLDVAESSSCTIYGNQLTDNNYGIQLNRAGNNIIISDNKFTNNGLYFLNRHSNATILNNTVNDKELLYLENEHDLILDNVSIGQLFLIDCKNITMKNIEISNASIGIEIIDSDNFLITKSKIHSNLGTGITFVDGCRNTIITHSDISNNTKGIYTKNSQLYESNISGNTLRFNGRGIEISCSKTTVTDNIIENCNQGMDITCSKTTVSDNIIENCNQGIVFSSGLQSVLTNNQITHNNIGLYLEEPTFSCIIHSNNFIDNQKHADFVIFPIIGCGGRFLNNYWDDLSSSGLKVIFGKRYIISGFGYWGLEYSPILPWVRFDWNPAQEPYDIGV